MSGPRHGRRDTRADDVARVTTSGGHQLHALLWHPSGPVPAEGPGPPDVLLVHGLASNALLWQDVAAGLADAGHRVVAYDQRAHGRSERAADGFAWDGVVGDLADVVAALDLDRPIGVGQSWGGNVVLETAARAPGILRSVVAIDGGHIDLRATFDDVEAAWAALTPPPLDERAFAEVREESARRFEGWPPNARRAQLANLTVTPDGLTAPALRRKDHELVVRALWEQRPAVSAAAVEIPVLVAPCRRAGDSQERAAAVERLVEAAPRARVHWFEGADHDVHAQRPDEVVAVLLGAVADGFLA